MRDGVWPATDYAKTVLLERPTDTDRPRRDGLATIERYGTTEIAIHAQAPDGGWLVLNDIWHPWWRATIDGAPTQILRADVAFRAVALSPGAHDVRFSFHPIRGGRGVAVGLARSPCRARGGPLILSPREHAPIKRAAGGDRMRPETELSRRTDASPQTGALAAAATLDDGPPSRLDRHRLGKIAGSVFSVGVFALSLFVLARVVAKLNLSDLRVSITSTHDTQIIAAAALATLSYLALTGYDALAVRQLRVRMPYRITAFGSFASYAISFTLGFPLITGGTVRYWIYSRAGLSAGKVASLTIIAGFTFWIGMASVVGASLLLAAERLSALDFVAPNLHRAIAVAIFAAIAAYLVWVGRARRRVKLQGFRLELPGVLPTLGQMALGITDLCAAAGVLFMLLPASQGLDFTTFVGLYVFACMLGIASHAPGGIGVFEATMLRFIPGASEEKVLAALLLFRVIYYIVPFILALCSVGRSRESSALDRAARGDGPHVGRRGCRRGVRATRRRVIRLSQHMSKQGRLSGVCR